MQDFRKLRVWQLSHEIGLEVARTLPEREARRIPGLRSQAIRAATSIGWNIAEGCGKNSPRELHRSLETALGSLSELESQLQFARDAKVLPDCRYGALGARCTTLRRMLISFMTRLSP